ncbi:MAG TPA: HGxxPAAW family protein [Trebonia sp.]
MSEQQITEHVTEESPLTLLPGAPHTGGHNSGRPISWVGTSITVVGFIIGGVAFFPRPEWILFWVGAGIAIVGCFILLFSKAFSTDWY